MADEIEGKSVSPKDYYKELEALPFIDWGSVSISSWAKRVLLTSWDFVGKATGNSPNAVEAFLVRLARNDKLSYTNLSNRDCVMLENIRTDYRLAFNAFNKRR